MVRLLPILLIITVLIVGFFFFKTQKPKELVRPIATTPTSQAQPVVQESSDISLLKQTINLLQTQVTALQKDLNQLKTEKSTSSSPQTIVITKSPLYIPLGSGGIFSDRDWNSLSAYEVSIDPADYIGYTSMQLEVNFRMMDRVGEAGVRLFNQTDGNAVSNSDVSTNADSFSLYSSNKFTVSSGRRNYRLQLKSTEGYDVALQTARIKVNF